MGIWDDLLLEPELRGSGVSKMEIRDVQVIELPEMKYIQDERHISGGSGVAEAVG